MEGKGRENGRREAGQKKDPRDGKFEKAQEKAYNGT
jgi:hypothetical protein